MKRDNDGDKFMAIALTHLALHVEDIEACVAFYQDYAAMSLVHERGDEHHRIVWLADKNEEQHQVNFIIVLIAGGPQKQPKAHDFSHIGFALESKEAVDAIALKAKAAGILAWDVCEEAYPVGYYCGLRSPCGNFVEFSFGQPLGPGAKQRI